jgi:hypothetical protein
VAPCRAATSALERAYEVAVQVDGDGQHDPRYIPELLERLRGEDEQKNINLAVLRGLEIPYPDLAYQVEVLGEYDCE